MSRPGPEARSDKLAGISLIAPEYRFLKISRNLKGKAKHPDRQPQPDDRIELRLDRGSDRRQGHCQG